jgi:hypothetical protein
MPLFVFSQCIVVELHSASSRSIMRQAEPLILDRTS